MLGIDGPTPRLDILMYEVDPNLEFSAEYMDCVEDIASLVSTAQILRLSTCRAYEMSWLPARLLKVAEHILERNTRFPEAEAQDGE